VTQVDRLLYVGLEASGLILPGYLARSSSAERSIRRSGRPRLALHGAIGAVMEGRSATDFRSERV